MADPLGGYVPDTVKNDEPIREPIARLDNLIHPINRLLKIYN